MKKIFVIIIAVLAFGFSSFARDIPTISGVVIDADTRDPIPMASVTVRFSTIGTMTNMFGEYTLELRDFPVTLVCSSTGYISQTKDVFYGNVVNFELKPNNN